MDRKSNTKTFRLIRLKFSMYRAKVEMIPAPRAIKKNQSNSFWIKSFWEKPKSEIKAIIPSRLIQKANLYSSFKSNFILQRFPIYWVNKSLQFLIEVRNFGVKLNCSNNSLEFFSEWHIKGNIIRTGHRCSSKDLRFNWIF